MPGHYAILIGIVLIATAMNIPLGRLRARERKYSFRWFLYIHLAIPIIAGLRIGFHFDYHVIPLLLASAILGQVLGNRWAT